MCSRHLNYIQFTKRFAHFPFAFYFLSSAHRRDGYLEYPGHLGNPHSQWGIGMSTVDSYRSLDVLHKTDYKKKMYL